MRFCTHCGASWAVNKLDQVGALAGSAATAERPGDRDLGSVFSGERKHVTMLFADLTGSLGLLADRDPEDARLLLESVLNRMIVGAEAFGGNVTQVMGDGIMAIFGAPAAIEDHALRACHAALRMQSDFENHAAPFPLELGQKLRIRVGINSGEIVVAERGDGFNFQYAAFGEAAHLAARMEQIANPGGILISGNTHALVSGQVTVENMGPVSVKGLNRSVPAFRLITATTGGVGMRKRRNKAPFIGRETALQSLREMFKNVNAGRGMAVVVTGEPGSGKSRLCGELLRDIPPGCVVLRSGGLSFMQGTPYLTVLEFLRSRLEPLGSAESSTEMRSRVLSWLTGLGGKVQNHIPMLLDLFGIGGPCEGWIDLPAEDRRRLILDATSAILNAESADNPVVVVIDDLQWIDEASAGLIAELASRIHSTRTLLLMNARSEYRPDWTNGTNCKRVELENFAEIECRLFLDMLLGTHSSLSHLKALLMRHTAGNAFFLEESIQALCEAGSLAGRPGNYKIYGDAPMLRIPVKVQDVIAMRIDRLRPAAKQLLQAAAVLGLELNRMHLECLTGKSNGIAVELTELLAAGFLIPAENADYFTFRHVMSHDVVYASLLQRTRVWLHERALVVMENDLPARMAEPPELLAHHAVRGEVWDRAVTYLLAAARVALSRSDAQRCLSFLEKALALLTRLPPNEQAWHMELELRLEMRNALFSLGRRSEILDHLSAAERLARSLNDPRGLARALCNLCHWHWQMGHWETAVESGQQALELADRLNDVGLRVGTRFYMGLAAYAMADYSVAGTLLAANVTTLTEDLARERFGMVALPAAVSRSYLALCLAEQGSFDQAAGFAKQAQILATENGRPFDQIQSQLALGGIGLIQGVTTDAVPPLEYALRLCHSANVPALLARSTAALVYAYALAGQTERALDLTAKPGAEPGAATWAICLRWIAEALLLAGQHEAAGMQAISLLNHCRSTKQQGVEAWTLHLVASVHVRGGQFTEAKAALDAAVALAMRRSMCPLLARCYLSSAELRLVCGDRDLAVREWQNAVTFCAKSAMSAWCHRSPFSGIVPLMC